MCEWSVIHKLVLESIECIVQTSFKYSSREGLDYGLACLDGMAVFLENLKSHDMVDATALEYIDDARVKLKRGKGGKRKVDTG